MLTSGNAEFLLQRRDDILLCVCVCWRERTENAKSLLKINTKYDEEVIKLISSHSFQLKLRSEMESRKACLW